MSYRDRRLAKAARLRGWATKRDGKAATAHARVEAIASNIPLGQPVLSGHHSQRHAERDQERIRSGMRAAIDNTRTANEFRSRADNIEDAAERAIYSDDRDAVERLEARIADLEAQRDRIKTYNASCRKGKPDVSLLDTGQREDLAVVLTCCAYACPKDAFPAYALTNLGGSISRQRHRLGQLRQQQAARARVAAVLADEGGTA